MKNFIALLVGIVVVIAIFLVKILFLPFIIGSIIVHGTTNSRK